MRVFVTGGAGFIGCNASSRLLKEGHEVVVFDNLSRRGTLSNLLWLREQGNLGFVAGDLRNAAQVATAVQDNGPFDLVLHLAAQVAVTTSVTNPREDFEINAMGTFNLLEALRQHNPDAFLIYASTNKVYGGMENIEVELQGERYGYRDYPNGISEESLLDFHSPYGCSKGAADQYVRDYGRIYGIPSVVFRQSCIYGYRQFGIEDQGWVAWFTIANELGKDITIYGDGKQVRDVLFIDDLVNAYLKAYENRDKTTGRIYNVGGGAGNTMSLLELLSFMEDLCGKKITYTWDDWRPGDQKVFVCDIAKAAEDFGWKPEYSPQAGVEKLWRWVRDNREMISRELG
jgi:CDP-paratose 2-epimerase